MSNDITRNFEIKNIIEAFRKSRNPSAGEIQFLEHCDQNSLLDIANNVDEMGISTTALIFMIKELASVAILIISQQNSF